MPAWLQKLLLGTSMDRLSLLGMTEQLAGAATVTFVGFLAGRPSTQSMSVCMWLTQYSSLFAGFKADVPLQSVPAWLIRQRPAQAKSASYSI